MTSAHDVADELRRRLPGVGTLKLHKLLYYAAGWHLAWVGDELFDEPVEAWVNGPVVARLWADEKHGRQRPPRQGLTDRQVATIDYVVARYGALSGSELIEKTHQEDPWRALSQADPPIEAGGSARISPESMRAWFEADEEFAARGAEVARLRQEQLDADPFRSPRRLAGLGPAIERAVSGEKVRHTRPA